MQGGVEFQLFNPQTEIIKHLSQLLIMVRDCIRKALSAKKSWIGILEKLRITKSKMSKNSTLISLR